MNAKREQHQRLVELFQAALAVADGERAAWLRSQCGADAALRARLERMLAADAAPGLPLDPATPVDLETLARHAGAPPREIGPFTILRRIASGATATVYEARRGETGTTVALKVLQAFDPSPQMLRRFLGESELLRRLHHPGIAKILDAGMAEGASGPLPWISMERVEGESILAHADAHGLGATQRVDLMIAVCDTVDYAHARGIVHRDLKPANVLVGADGVPVVLDFGIARLAGERSAGNWSTGLGQMVGTLAHMSPEQTLGDPFTVGPRSDVYALGLLAHELLCGAPPIPLSGLQSHEAVRRIQMQEPARASVFRANLGEDLDKVLLRALEKEPADRYPSVDALAADLRRYRLGAAVAARFPSLSRRVRRFADQNRPLALGIGVAVGALLFGSALATRFGYLEARHRGFAEAHAAEAARSADTAQRQTYLAMLAAASSEISGDEVSEAWLRVRELPRMWQGWEARHVTWRLDTRSRAIRLDVERLEAAAATRRDGVFAFAAAGRQGTQHEIRTSERGGGGQRLVAAFETATTALAWSDDGSLLAAGGADGVVRLIEVSTGALRGSLSDGGNPVDSVRFSPDGEFVAATDANGRARAWRSSGGPPLWVVVGRGRLDFAPEGFLVAVPFQESVQVRDVRDGRLVRSLERPLQFVEAVAWSDDGQRLAAGSKDQHVWIWKTPDWTLERTLDGHTGHVFEVAWHADSRHLSSVSRDGSIRVWNAVTGEPLGTHRLVDKPAVAIWFQTDSLEVAWAGRGGSISGWNAVAERRSRVLEGHTEFVYAADFVPGRNRAVSVAWDGTLRIWDTLRGVALATVDTGERLTCLAVHPDGRRAAAGGRNGRVRVFDLDTGAVLQEHDTTDPSDDRVAAVASLAWQPGTGWLVSAFETGRLAFWDETGEVAVTGVELPRFTRVAGIAFDASGRVLAAAAADGWVRVWELEGASARQRSQLEMPAGDGAPQEAWSVAIDPLGRWVAAGGVLGPIRLWELSSGDVAADLVGHTDRVLALAFHPDGTRLASGGDDNEMRLWDLEHMDQVLELRGHGSYVHGLAFHADGSQLLSASGDGDLRNWDSVEFQKRRAERLADGTARREVEERVRDVLATTASPRDAVRVLRQDPELDPEHLAAALDLALAAFFDPAAQGEAVPAAAHRAASD
ncbi:MAG TPA: protein kinase [Planctomycetota bacterium]